MSYLITPDTWLYRLFDRADKRVAKWLGFSGKYTLSDECASCDRRVCKVIRALTNLIDPDHCNKARAARIRRESP